MFVLALGHFYCALTVLILCTLTYFEVLRVTLRDHDFPFFQAAYWLLFTAFATLRPYIVDKLSRIPDTKYQNLNVDNKLLQFFIRILPRLDNYLAVLQYLLITLGLLRSIFKIRTNQLKKELKTLFFIFIICLTVVYQSISHIKTIDKGLIWFTTSIASVALNDTFAYLVGRQYGKTSLINVSPNKTIEGFLGAAVLTPIFTLLVGEVLQRFKLFTCADLGFSPAIPLFHDVTQDCKVSSRFALQPIKILGLNLFYRHAWVDFIIFGLFASFGAPLGGFLSSAIKRYFKIKDYSNTFPGHGGYSDRFDCQLIMAMFTWLYVRSITSAPSIPSLLRQINLLDNNEKSAFFTQIGLNAEL